MAHLTDLTRVKERRWALQMACPMPTILTLLFLHRGT